MRKETNTKRGEEQDWNSRSTCWLFGRRMWVKRFSKDDSTSHLRNLIYSIAFPCSSVSFPVCANSSHKDVFVFACARLQPDHEKLLISCLFVHPQPYKSFFSFPLSASFTAFAVTCGLSVMPVIFINVLST